MSLFSTVKRTIQQVAGSQRLRGEVGWLIIHKVVELPIALGILKILTGYLGEKGFAEFNLIENAGIIVGGLLLTPMLQTYLRYFHTARALGTARSAGTFMLKWQTAATTLVLLAILLLAKSISKITDLSILAVIAGGLYFFMMRWRMVGSNTLVIRRERKAMAIQYLSALLLQCVLFFIVFSLGWRSSATALLVAAFCEGLFGIVILTPQIREIFSLPPGGDSRIGRMVFTFGLPFGLFEIFQWFQGFSDRYVLAFALGKDIAGIYIAAYQVCGIPFMVLQGTLDMLLLPIAYQRAKDPNDIRQLWSADKLLLGGAAFYLLVCLIFVPIYAIWGLKLLEIFTTKSFAMLPLSAIIMMTIGRSIQCMDAFFRDVFSVHNKVDRLLWYRLAGAAVAVPIYWFGIRAYGILGAAGGMLVASLAYAFMVSVGPSGCLWLFLRDRKAANARKYEQATPC